MNNSLLLQSNTAFNPPEILTSKGVFSSSDSWSISCILSYCLTGKIPFQKENAEETVQSILNDQFDIDDDISDHAKNFIYCGLIKNPLMRTQFKAIMSTKFMEGIPLEMMATKKSAATQSYSPKTFPSTIGKKQLIRISYKSFIPEVKKSYRTRSGTTFW
ncbi:Serine/threonine-protein kinase, putative [Trichomonas vaginalis G3]|uniref:Serine/threonine-protein kinase, putative n=1 Tax=Trichomonas vaginalis (strain ATCC PRA-98 / G3) TaxID=412133 RepID=A2EXH5_TRIV3|nr:protein kinase protein [Trichomonas vaginalis G3]EAY02665.1 Serine/threonine-protein kinase, putative [Trichomonas vaginalis G3]KAI5550148.1 protein kinase protein [Trichomonas vaginalis G3]|eukprot:XP_001314888.1 Serine/threonine-protein kinase [Trichomonas vaginalis G3]